MSLGIGLHIALSVASGIPGNAWVNENGVAWVNDINAYWTTS